MWRSVRTKLAATLLAVALAATAIVSLFVFEREKDAIIDDRRDGLAAIATVQQARLEAWVASAAEGLALIASRTQLRNLLEDYQEPDTAELERRIMANDMAAILADASQASRNVVAVHILDRSGVVAASTADRAGDDLSGEPYVAGAQPGRPILSHVDRTDAELVGVHGGVVEKDGEAIGWVVVEQRWAPVLDVLIDRTGLGETGEAILARPAASPGGVISLGPLLGDDGAALEPMPVEDRPDLPVVRAVDGITSDAVDATDYRDGAVVAATRPIAGTDWGLVVKQDRAEIIDSTDDLRNNLLLATGAMTIIAVVAALLLAEPLTRHITDLTAVARRVTRGDRSARAEVTTHDEIGELAAAFNLMTDELVNHEAELETRKTQLESFLYVSSHDLKTPLRSISSFSQLLRLDYGPGLDERGGYYLDHIEQGASATITVIDDLLSYVRVDHNDHEMTVVDLTAAATTARELLSSTINETGAEVTIDDLGHVEGNLPLLRQLFQNLLGNALKFRRPDGPPIVAVSRAERYGSGNDGPVRGGHQVGFVVADNGIGVPEEYRARVFSPFERLHSKDEVPGTGLGLAVCERIVTLHHGTIEFVDSPLGGAAVLVRLAGRPGRP